MYQVYCNRTIGRIKSGSAVFMWNNSRKDIRGIDTISAVLSLEGVISKQWYRTIMTVSKSNIDNSDIDGVLVPSSCFYPPLYIPNIGFTANIKLA